MPNGKGLTKIKRDALIADLEVEKGKEIAELNSAKQSLEDDRVAMTAQSNEIIRHATNVKELEKMISALKDSIKVD
jgi:hypothetical protein